MPILFLILWRTYSSCGTRAPAQAVLPAAQGIQPADELAAHGAKAASGQVAQVVQQVVGQ